MTDPDARSRICTSLGIESVANLHEIILAGAAKDADWLLRKGLNAKNLTELGYDASGMTTLGYRPPALEKLGYPVKSDAPTPESTPEPSKNDASYPRELVAKGYRAAQLRQAGIRVHHCKAADISAREMYELGFSLDELAPEFTPTELRTLGFNPRELSRFFSGQQLRSAGYTASDMKLAGYAVRDLVNFGYNRNHIVTAGFATRDLLREGLSKQIHDKSQLHHE